MTVIFLYTVLFDAYGKSVVPCTCGLQTRAGKDFNPRTHKGCDRRKTHNLHRLKQFQSTHPQGVRRIKHLTRARISEFQSTHPQGVRHAAGPASWPQSNFNPRTHKGCDRRKTHNLHRLKQFQSTHPQGVRHSGKVLGIGSDGFQSTHPQGVRPGWSGPCGR